MRYPLDPYVAEVADALKAAGLPAVETWTEPVIPVDHVIAIAVEPRGTVHLVWDATPNGWKFFAYAHRVGTNIPEAGRLPGCVGRTNVSIVVAATQNLLAALARTV